MHRIYDFFTPLIRISSRSDVRRSAVVIKGQILYSLFTVLFLQGVPNIVLWQTGEMGAEDHSKGKAQ